MFDSNTLIYLWSTTRTSRIKKETEKKINFFQNCCCHELKYPNFSEWKNKNKIKKDFFKFQNGRCDEHERDVFAVSRRLHHHLHPAQARSRVRTHSRKSKILFSSFVCHIWSFVDLIWLYLIMCSSDLIIS